MMKQGDKLHGFEVTRVRKIDEIDSVLCEMEHGCGAKLAFIDRPDTNKSFAITFKTLPEDDTGVFHILEHSVLCGSDKFPVKEPFVELLKSSLKTFLNAMTYNDKTVYPVASRNDKDFYNLVDVYMDAVLNPRALKNENIFRQEGWHYELSEEGTLSYNGVVYNEMKGAYSSADSVADEELMQMLFPDSPYSKDSGGNPKFIPSLTYEEFVEAHRRFYNPSNSLIFLDGSVKLDEILPLLDSYLSKYENKRTVLNLELADYTPGARREAEYEISPDESEDGKCRVYLAGRTSAFDDKERGVALGILRTALAGSNESPLKRGLLESGLCEDVNLRINDGLLCGFYDLEICNVKRENIDTVIVLVKDLLTKVYKDGLDRERLYAIFNSAEFKNREKDFGSLPKGLVFGLSMLDTWLWDGDPADTLTLTDTFSTLRKKVEDGYFERLLSEYFLESEPVVLALIPSKTLGARRDAEEKAILEKIKSSMSNEELEKIRADAAALKAWQSAEDSPEALASLPTLTLADVDAAPEHVPTDTEEILGCTSFNYRLSTSGITYLELFFDASDLSTDELLLLPTLTSLYKNVATAKGSATSLQNRILSELGTLSFNAVSLADTAGAPKVYLQVSASSLEEKADMMTELILEVIYTSDLSDRRALKNAIAQSKLATEDAFITSGHVQAINRAAAYTSAAAMADEYLSGYDQFAFLKSADADFDAVAEGISAKLHGIKEKLFRRERLTVAVTSSSSELDFIKKLISSIKDGGTIAGCSEIQPLGIKNEGILIPSQVSYAAAADNILPNEKPTGAQIVARSIVSYAHLWNTVRVQGGAYGAGLVVRKNGFLAFYSYRDPSPRRTLDCYAGSGDFLRSFIESREPLEKFIIGAFGDYDTLTTPRSAGARAAVNAIRGWTEDMEKRFREEIVAATDESILHVAELLDKVTEKAAVCVIGPESALSSCSDVLKARLEI